VLDDQQVPCEGASVKVVIDERIIYNELTDATGLITINDPTSAGWEATFNDNAAWQLDEANRYKVMAGPGQIEFQAAQP